MPPPIDPSAGARRAAPARRALARLRRAALVGALALLTAAVCAVVGPAQARTTGAPRTQPVDMVVIHSTGGPTCDAQNRPIWVPGGELEDNLRVIGAHPTLGIHWMIDRDGTVRASVPEAQVAHHVLGHSRRSIAVELINDGDGRDPFPPAQIDALVELLQGIAHRHPQVVRTGVVRHSDLDRGRLPCDPVQRRKVDPGAAYPHAEVLRRVFDGAWGHAGGGLRRP